VLALNRRVNDYALRHPWRFAGMGFLLMVGLSLVILVVFHRSFFVGLFPAFGAMLGSAIGWSGRRRGRPMPTYQKLSIVALWLVGFFVLGSLLEVTGLLR
jgi:hypothetical protein